MVRNWQLGPRLQENQQIVFQALSPTVVYLYLQFEDKLAEVEC